MSLIFSLLYLHRSWQWGIGLMYLPHTVCHVSCLPTSWPGHRRFHCGDACWPHTGGSIEPKHSVGNRASDFLRQIQGRCWTMDKHFISSVWQKTDHFKAMNMVQPSFMFVFLFLLESPLYVCLRYADGFHSIGKTTGFAGSLNHWFS